MSTGLARYPRLAFAAVALAVGIGVCLVVSTKPSPAHAAQKDKSAMSTPYSVVDPACDYLKGSEPTLQTAGKRSAAIGGCTRCHAGATVADAKNYDKYKSTEFVLLNESVTWEQKDIHAAAMKCLDDPLGQQMEKALKKYRPEGYSVKTAAECLACHSSDTAPRKPLAEKTAADFATAPGGVTCTLCHGMHLNWQNEHWTEPEQAGQPMPWRDKPPEYKFAAGMHDLRNPVVKAALCVSCHVGNASEGKVMTHEMYEAGHPPLPPFEFVSLIEGMPRHWGYPYDLKYFARVKPADTWRLFHFHPADKEAYLARRVAVGAIAAVRAEAELLAADAEAARAKDRGGIDMARLDCYVCHHERNPGDPKNRWIDDNTGRPPLRGVIGVPAGVVARHAEGIEVGGLKAKAAGFEEKWGTMKNAATARSFGDLPKVKDAARELAAWCDAFLKVQSECAEPLYTPEKAKRLREMIATEALGKSGLHPEIAMWLAWAHTELAKEEKIVVSEEALRQLGRAIPQSVRTPPFSVQVGNQKRPRPGSPLLWMDKIKTFEADKFSDAFGKLLRN